MNRSQFAHAVRAAAEIIKSTEVIVIGSQAVHASIEELVESAHRSVEADIAARNDITGYLADLIDGSIGEASMFHETHGYYAQGVEITTAILPNGWEQRLIPFKNEETNGITAHCLEIHDLWISKSLAGRDKDFEFCKELAIRYYVDIDTLQDRLNEVSNQPTEKINQARNWIKKCFDF
jgi:hypothetical protein